MARTATMQVMEFRMFRQVPAKADLCPCGHASAAQCPVMADLRLRMSQPRRRRGGIVTL